jgi:serine O-acetyltransferase
MLLNLIRLASRLHAMSIPLAPSVVSRFVRLIYGCEISYLADIHPTARFPHKALGVVIGDHVVVGPRCRILQNVTIGGRAGRTGVPVLGADVLVGVGAAVLGPITLGDGAVVGANAVVLTDVPPGLMAVGVPAVVKVRRDG